AEPDRRGGFGAHRGHAPCRRAAGLAGAAAVRAGAGIRRRLRGPGGPGARPVGRPAAAGGGAGVGAGAGAGRGGRRDPDRGAVAFARCPPAPGSAPPRLHSSPDSPPPPLAGEGWGGGTRPPPIRPPGPPSARLRRAPPPPAPPPPAW